jgi:hypothetical protein
MVPHLSPNGTRFGAAASADDLPFVDEHAIEVAAPLERVWEAIGRTASSSFGGRSATFFARLVGAAETRPHGDPTEPGSAIVGFRVSRADAPLELALEGEHRFSRYALTFRLEALPGGRSRVRAETRAAFPGLHGRAYRALVIGTGGHILVVNRLLRAVRARAERPRSQASP